VFVTRRRRRRAGERGFILLDRQKEIGYTNHTSGGSWISDMRALEIHERLYFPI
jgi:hypothetical protein